MIRASMLRNFPVVLSNSRIGILQNVWLDLAQKRVCALIVSCGLKGKRLVFSENVTAIADGFILVKESNRYSRDVDAQRVYFVRDTTGLLLGRITDYAVDEDSLKISAVEMISGYLPAGFKRRIWIYDYCTSSEARNEISVPAMLGYEPNCIKGGIDGCAFQP